MFSKIKNFFWNDLYNRASSRLLFWYSLIMSIISLTFIIMTPFTYTDHAGELPACFMSFVLTMFDFAIIKPIFGIIYLILVYIENRPKYKEKRLKDTPFITSKFYKIFLIVQVLLIIPCAIIAIMAAIYYILMVVVGF